MFPFSEFVVWSAIISLLTLASRRLMLETGGTVFSIGILLSGSALFAYWVAVYLHNPIFALIASFSIGIIIGALHAGFVLKLGTESVLLATVIAHMIWTEAWLSLPLFTGGSGGFFWPGASTFHAIASLGFAFLVVVAGELSGRTSHARFQAAILIHSHKSAAAYGVNRWFLLLSSYARFGAIGGLVGYSLVHWYGFLSLNNSGMAFSTAILLITLAATRLTVLEVAILCCIQALFRTYVRSVVPISPLTSHCLDLALPLFILMFVMARHHTAALAKKAFPK